jgi:GTPase SAR1 family protein
MQAANGTPIIFVGNKIDMREDSYLGKEAVITKEAGQKVAEKLGVKYL